MRGESHPQKVGERAAISSRDRQVGELVPIVRFAAIRKAGKRGVGRADFHDQIMENVGAFRDAERSSASHQCHPVRARRAEKAIVGAL